MSIQQREKFAALATTVGGMICWGWMFYNIYQGMGYAGPA